jgi:8-oxo-dGTP pyrophosphatase MutT (NUDIX family)
MVSQPKDAATVVLVRNCSESVKGIEVLMVLRNPRSDFVPGSYVFPGGGLEKEDCLPEVESLCSGMDREGAVHILGDLSTAERALGIWVAGIRETFEEVGLMMACRNDGSIVSITTDEEVLRFREYRRALCEEKLTFYDLLIEEKLTLPVSRLHYFSRWITPELSPIRYDTRFFIAEAPASQEALHDGLELTKHLWVTPGEALERYWRGTFDMVVPTVITLEDLDGFSTVDEAIHTLQKRNIESHCIKVEIDEKEGIVVYAPDGRIFKHEPPSVK